MGLLHLAAVLALAVIAFAADCDNTKFLVDGNLQKNFNVGPNSKCVYALTRQHRGLYRSPRRWDLLRQYAFFSVHNVRLHVQRVRRRKQHDIRIPETNTYWAPGTVKLAISTGPTSNVAIRIAVSVSSRIKDSDMYWAPGALNLRIVTGELNTITVNISVVISVATKDAVVETANVITGTQPIVVSNNMKLGTTYVYKSTSLIILSVVALVYESPGKSNYFDSVFVYGGQGPNARLIGSLNDVLSFDSDRLATTSVTLFPTSQPQLIGKVIINNDQNIAAFDFTSMRYTLSHGSYSLRYIFLESPGRSSILSFGSAGNQTDYPIITGIDFWGDSDITQIVQVWSGLPTSKMAGKYIMRFTDSSAANMPPQSFPGTAITFTLNSGGAKIFYTSALTPPMK